LGESSAFFLFLRWSKFSNQAKEIAMKETTGQAPANEQQPENEQSPAEKLEGEPQPGSVMPGAENPESQEIKKEINPNTE
jgi:hypothetical protein